MIRGDLPAPEIRAGPLWVRIFVPATTCINIDLTFGLDRPGPVSGLIAQKRIVTLIIIISQEIPKIQSNPITSIGVF
jgi:hypothetical protein